MTAARCCICGVWVPADAYGVDAGRQWCFACFAGEQAVGRGADRRLLEAAAMAAAELVAIAFNAGWPEIPSGQPQWLNAQALATAALGDVDAGGELAQAMVVGGQEARINGLLRELGYRPSVYRREGQR